MEIKEKYVEKYTMKDNLCMLEDSSVNKWGKIQSKGGKWSHVFHEWAHRVISLSASSNVKDLSRLTEEQERRCLQSDQHSWTYRTNGCVRREKGWMNEWRRRNVIQNQYERYVSINAALAVRFTPGLIKARSKKHFSHWLICNQHVKYKQSDKHLSEVTEDILTAFINTLSALLIRIYLDICIWILSFSRIWKKFLDR